VISLEQVQLLEAKIAKAIEYLQRLTAENNALVSERSGLQTKLDSCQKRIDELEVHVMRFKEDHGRIEDGILAALNRLSQFEEAFENSLKEDKVPDKRPAVKREKIQKPDFSNSQEFFEIPQAEPVVEPAVKPEKTQAVSSGSLGQVLVQSDSSEESEESAGELDIF